MFTDEVVTTHGPIEPDKENIRQEPYSLPQGFMWDTLDLSNSEVVRECVCVGALCWWKGGLFSIPCLCISIFPQFLLENVV